MDSIGYIKLYRKILQNPIVCKDADHFAVWCYLLLNATHSTFKVVHEGKQKDIYSGQLITGRKVIATQFVMSESKVQRILKLFENGQLIEQQTTPRNRLISILKWDGYQKGEQLVDQQLNNKRTTSEQQVNTNNNVENVKNDIYTVESQNSNTESEPKQSTDNNISDVNNLINTKKVTALAISQFYESIWELYPIKKGKASVKDSQKKKLYTYGFEEIKRCIERYKKDKEEWRAFKDGSTFFNSGYVDYLDENYNKKTTKESKTPTQLQYDDFDIMTGKPI